MTDCLVSEMGSFIIVMVVTSASLSQLLNCCLGSSYSILLGSVFLNVKRVVTPSTESFSGLKWPIFMKFLAQRLAHMKHTLLLVITGFFLLGDVKTVLLK